MNSKYVQQLSKTILMRCNWTAKGHRMDLKDKKKKKQSSAVVMVKKGGEIIPKLSITKLIYNL